MQADTQADLQAETHAAPRPPLPAGDYISPNLQVTLPDRAFPHLAKGDLAASTWPYLRRNIGHNWYVDARNPTVGFLSRDEAAILYNTARMFHGKPCLEIGCWRGWSTVHLALGSGALDVIDPALAEPSFASDVRAACARAGVLDSISLHAGYSPAAVEQLAGKAAKRWSLIFVDGDHDGDAPLRDAEVVARHAAETCMVLFHDLASPDVADGLDYFRRHGWQTRIYQTAQIMGVAWRGDLSPVDHIPDPSVAWVLPDHLAGYAVSGPPATGATSLVRALPAGIVQRERDAAVARAAALEQDFAALAAQVPDLREAAQHASRLREQLAAAQQQLEQETGAAAKLGAIVQEAESLAEQRLAERDEARNAVAALAKDFTALAAQMAELRATAQQTSLVRSELATVQGRLEEALAEAQARDASVRDGEHLAERGRAERDDALARAALMEQEFAALASRVPDVSATAAQAALLRAELDAAQERLEQQHAILRDGAHEVARLAAERDAEAQRAMVAEANLEQVVGRMPATTLAIAQARAAEAARDKLRAVLADAAATVALTDDPQQQRRAAIGALAEWMQDRRILFGLLRRPGLHRIALLRDQAALRGIDALITPAIGHAMCQRRTLLGLVRRSRVSRICIILCSLLDADRAWIAQAHGALVGKLHGSTGIADAPAVMFQPLTQENQTLQRRIRAMQDAKVADEAALLDARIELATLRATPIGTTVAPGMTHG